MSVNLVSLLKLARHLLHLGIDAPGSWALGLRLDLHRHLPCFSGV